MSEAKKFSDVYLEAESHVYTMRGLASLLAGLLLPEGDGVSTETERCALADVLSSYAEKTADLLEAVNSCHHAIMRNEA